MDHSRTFSNRCNPYSFARYFAAVAVFAAATACGGAATVPDADEMAVDAPDPDAMADDAMSAGD